MDDEGMEGGVAVALRAVEPDIDPRSRRQVVMESLDEPRLPDPGFAGDDDGLAAAARRAFPAIEQQAQFAFAADAIHAGRSPVEALGLAELPQHLPEGDGLVDAFEAPRAHRAALELRGGQPPRAVGDHERPGTRELLDAGRDIGDLAGDGDMGCLAAADDAADQHGTGGDADPDAKRDLGIGGAPVERREDRQPGADGARRLILMGGGISEIGENAIALVLRNEAVEETD